MRFRGRVLLPILGTFALVAALRANPGDVENSHDYAGFPRLEGFVITDYDEDNPADFDFPVAHSLPTDSGRVEMIHVQGHRYVIRYQAGTDGRAPSLFEIQRHYERLASDAGFTVEKSGAVGDVTETFHRTTATHQIWIYLEPAITVNVLTVMESSGVDLPPPRLTVTADTPILARSNSAGNAPPVDSEDDTLFTALSQEGRVVLPVLFQPGKDELAPTSQALIDRVVAMMQRHPDLFLRIEGHTDNTGDPSENLRLSAQRALAVQALLIAEHIDMKRLDAVGVGGLQPLASNGTAEGRGKNRRIELVMWKKYPAFHAGTPNGSNYYPNSTSTAAKHGL